MKLDGARILPFPSWADNPYLNVLYLASLAAGAQVRGTTLLPSLEAELAGAGAGDVLHIHWTAPICQAADSDADARARLERFTSAVLRAKSAGMAMVWTVHNVIPHDAAFMEQELELSRFLVDTADIIHIMTAETPDVVSEFYRLPEDKVTLIPHSSYQGIYGSHRTRESAREHFGIRPEEKAVLFFGQMRPYKGLDTLLAAVELAHSEEAPLVLLLAGKTHPDSLAALEAILPTSARVIRDHTFIADADVDLWFTAADLAVFPYRKILNSGSVHLAATYGVPCVLPGESHLRAQFAEESWVSFFERDDEVASLATLLRNWDDVDGAHRRSALRAAERFTPYMMSTAFAAALSGLDAAVSA
jgi:beta-1,4-mannosyltransferase